MEEGIGNPGHRGAIFEKLPSRIIKDRQEEIVPPQAPHGFGFEETEKLVRLARRRTGHEPPVGSCDMVAEDLAKLEKTELILEKKCVEIPVFGTQHHTQEGVSPSLLTISNALSHPCTLRYVCSTRSITGMGAMDTMTYNYARVVRLVYNVPHGYATAEENGTTRA